MLAIFNKNVVFQFKLAVVLAKTRDLHLGKMRVRFAWKTSKILRRTSMSSINCNTNNNSSSSCSSSSSSSNKNNNNKSESTSSRFGRSTTNNILSNNSSNSRSRSSIVRLAIDLILSNYRRKTRVGLGIFKYSGGRRVSQYVRCPKVPIPYVG